MLALGLVATVGLPVMHTAPAGAAPGSPPVVMAQVVPPDTTIQAPAAPDTTAPDTTRPASQPPRVQAARLAPQPVSPLGGFVLDETFSPQGRTFYSRFYAVWQAPPVTGFYTIRIEERPTPGRGTLVQVFVNDDIIHQARVQPGPDDAIREQALQGARRAYAFVRSGQGQLKIY